MAKFIQRQISISPEDDAYLTQQGNASEFIRSLIQERRLRSADQERLRSQLPLLAQVLNSPHILAAFATGANEIDLKALFDAIVQGLPKEQA